MEITAVALAAELCGAAEEDVLLAVCAMRRRLLGKDV